MATKKAAPKRSGYYTLQEGKAVPTRKHCPRCGPGVFLAEHKDRVSCGRCGYTEFRKKE